MKNKILQEFLNSNIKIKNKDYLIRYIDFCLNKNKGNRIKGKTSYHHIPPKADSCFPEYSNLKANPWNGTHLLYSEHYYAHWLLTEALDNYSQLSAFCAMNNKDIKNGRIEEKDLIKADVFQKKMEEMYIKRTANLNKKCLDGSSKMQKKSEKRNLTMDNTIINGKTKRQIASEKRLKSIDIRENGRAISRALNKKANGSTKTIAKLRGEMFSKTFTKKIIINGEETTKAKEQGKKLSESLIANGKFYKIMKDNEIILEKISEKDMRNMSVSLKKSTKERPLGTSKGARSTMIKHNKEKLIGYYSVEVNKGL